MSEFKENTVGWQLSQLKEPLRSICIGYFKHDDTGVVNRTANTLEHAMEICYLHGSGSSRFILGAKDYLIAPDCFDYTANAKGKEYKEGWELAKQCAPDAADFPPPTEIGENEDLTITFPAAVDNRTDKRLSMMSVEELLALPRKEIPEPAVVGYEPPTPIELPKPIDTIEKKHELRIQALEAQVKDMAWEMENLMSQVRVLNRQVFNIHLD